MRTPFLLSIRSAFAVAVLAGSAHATVFFTDGFDYPDGQLTSEDPTGSGLGANVSGGLWTAHSGGGASGAGRYVDVVSGQAELLIDGSEDVNRTTGGTIMGEGETWYYAAKFTVNDMRADPLTEALDNEYFIHFMSDFATLRGRAYVSAPQNGGTDYTLGWSASSGGQTITWGSDLSFGTQYTIVASYSFDDGNATVWLNPTSAASTSITDPTPNSNAPLAAIQALGLRQGSNGPFANPIPNHQVLVDVVSLGNSFDEVLAALGGGGTQPGDFDGDNDVDGADFLKWQRDDATPGGLADFQGNYGAGVTPAVASIGAVPEPTTMALGALAVAGLALRRRS